jgi:hypothetical protein
MKIKFIALISLIAVSLSFISCSKDEDRVSSDNSGVMLDSLFYSTIQEAIDEAEDGDTIYLTEGIYADKGDKNLRWNGDQKHLTITLHPNAEYAIIHCNGDGSGFKFGHTHRNTSDVIDGITIQNAGGYDDAGIYCDGASPLIKNCKISGCGYAGVFCDYAGPQIENTIITENKNGIIAYDYSSPLIQWCTIQGNSMDGVYITENASSIINNSLIVENKRGGIYCNNSSFQGINNTIANNVEWGIRIYEAKETTSNLMNSIIWGNEVGFKPETANLLIKYSCAQDSISAINPDSLGNIYEDPRFIFPDDYHLHQGSPCINAGDNEPVTWEVDIEGNPRIMFDIVDMGAYEWQGKSR